MKNKLTELDKQSIPDDILKLKEINQRVKKVVDEMQKTVDLLAAGVDPDIILKELTK